MAASVRPVTCPGALARELSRRTSRHGAIFANPAKLIKVVSVEICPEPKSLIWKMSEKLFVKMKLLKVACKIVTSLLPNCRVRWS